MGFEIAALRKDFNTLSNYFHDFKGNVVTYDGFEMVITSIYNKTDKNDKTRIHHIELLMNELKSLKKG